MSSGRMRFGLTKQRWCGLWMAVVILTAGPVYAQDPVRKASRGIVNIATGWVEVPKEVYTAWIETNPLRGFVVGMGWGFCKAARRMAGGFYDVVTCFIPYPKDYAPIVEPEFVLAL